MNGERRPAARKPLDGQGVQEKRDKENVIRVSTNRNTRFWIFLAKIYMKKYEEVEMQAFGDAISSCVRVAENLERFGYATFTDLKTITVVVNPKARTNENRRLKRVKLIVKMKKTEKFEELTENLRID